MSTIRLLLVAVLLSCCSPAAVRAAESGGPAAPQVNLDLLRDTIRANRKALIAVNLALTDEEAAKFWPLYERYQKEISGVGDRLAALFEDYITHFRDLSNEKAWQLTRITLSPRPTASRCNAPTSASSPRFCRRGLPCRRGRPPPGATHLPRRVHQDSAGRTVARFYQIENKMDAVLRYDLAGTIPVVELASGVPRK